MTVPEALRSLWAVNRYLLSEYGDDVDHYIDDALKVLNKHFDNQIEPEVVVEDGSRVVSAEWIALLKKSMREANESIRDSSEIVVHLNFLSGVVAGLV